MTAPRFAGIGGHHSARAGTVEWATPPWMVESIARAYGRLLDLDPCAPIEQPYPTALRTYTILDDGLSKPWHGDVWLNPPYADGVVDAWLDRLAGHGSGIALIFARTETETFFRNVWERASCLLFVRGRFNFHVIEPYSVVKTRRTFWAGDVAAGNAGAPNVLCGFGMAATDALAACEIDGKFVPLLIPRSVLGAVLEDAKTWREVVRGAFERAGGRLSFDDLYRALRRHPKAKANPNFDAKARQIVQQGPYRRVRRGVWELDL